MIVRHQCHNPPCVNPAHLLIGTNQDNSDDMTRALRSAKTYSWDTVQAIRDAWDDGLRIHQIAERFCVSRTLVRFYIRKVFRKFA
jgi:hypothetical protein